MIFKMVKGIFILFLFLFSTIDAFTITKNHPRQEFNLSQEAYSYLEEALAHMERGSVNREILNWNALRREVYKKASNALTPKDTYEAIELAISLLNDDHSFFMKPDQAIFFETKSDDQAIDIIQSNSRLINSQIGYLLVPPCNSLSEDSMKEYALSLQQEIQALDINNLSKWIVDLRGNCGGNMWPMVLGLRPLIEIETFGFFSDGSGEYYAWNFEGLSVKTDNLEICSLNALSYKLNQLHPQIAVLVDNQTASSGEATTIAFLGGDKTKVFGQKTAGYTSANEAIQLSDGATIFLATTYSADRLRRIYHDGITPDQITEVGDFALNEAIRWLETENN
ncbi:Nisin-resistance protein [Chlamydiales bacterium STE3]|nr:Nisin-resistance protein [Chlamydiales bacterium STE3]